MAQIVAIFTWLIISLSDVNFVLSQYTSDSCARPSVPKGTCIKVEQCETVTNILKKTPKTQEVLNYVNMLHCGFEGKDPKVCCPDFGDDDISTTQSPKKPVGDDVILKRQPSEKPVDAEKLLPKRDVCGIGVEDRIVGGDTTEPDEFPWMALLSFEKADGTKDFMCGGTLINNRYVLTAAHCVEFPAEKTLKLVSVRLGEHDIQNQNRDCVKYKFNVGEFCADLPQDVDVEEIIPHEDYSPIEKNQYNDIALIRLNKSVTYTDFIKPICLPLNHKKIENVTATAAGWGVTENLKSSQVKLKVKVNVRTNKECYNIYQQTGNRINNKQFCAGGAKGKDTCKGDSGGPLMQYVTNQTANWEQIGVVSYGRFPCGLEGWPGVYTKVDAYLEWIYSKLKE